MHKIIKTFISLSVCFGLWLGLSLTTSSVALAAEESFKAVAKTLVEHVARNVLPKESSKAVRKEGSGYVAYYNSVNPTQYTTEVRNTDGKNFVGLVRYKQDEYVCYGATKAEALKAPCKVKSSSNMTEIIAYANGRWIFETGK